MKEAFKAITEVVGDVAEIAINPFNPITWVKGIGTVAKAVAGVEKLSTGEDEFISQLPGPDKKQLVVDWLNEKIDLPLVGETTEAKIIGALIDGAVDVFNEVLGKRWGFKIPDKLFK